MAWQADVFEVRTTRGVVATGDRLENQVADGVHFSFRSLARLHDLETFVFHNHPNQTGIRIENPRRCGDEIARHAVRNGIGFSEGMMNPARGPINPTVDTNPATEQY